MLTIGNIKELQTEYNLSDDTLLIVCMQPDENEDFKYIEDETELEQVKEFDGVLEIDRRGDDAIILYPQIAHS